MEYRFYAYGHPNILGTHKTTIEFTKDEQLSLNGDCIVGVNSDFDLHKLMEFIKKSKNKNITITIKAKLKNKNSEKIEEILLGEINPDFNSDKEIVIRKTDFLSERTFAIRANKAAFGLSRDLIRFLKEKENKITIILKK